MRLCGGPLDLICEVLLAFVVAVETTHAETPHGCCCPGSITEEDFCALRLKHSFVMMSYAKCMEGVHWPLSCEWAGMRCMKYEVAEWSGATLHV